MTVRENLERDGIMNSLSLTRLRTRALIVIRFYVNDSIIIS